MKKERPWMRKNVLVLKTVERVVGGNSERGGMTMRLSKKNGVPRGYDHIKIQDCNIAFRCKICNSERQLKKEVLK